MVVLSGVNGSGKTTTSCIIGGDAKDGSREVDIIVDGFEYLDITIDNDVVILTANHHTLNGRVGLKQKEKTIFDTPRNIYYYDARYRDIAKYYGIPMIDTTFLSPQEVAESVKKIKHVIPFSLMTPNVVRSLCKLLVDGKSRQVYIDPDDDDYCYIIHKMNNKTTRYAIDMLRRNEINHAYICVNNNGVIYAKRLRNINSYDIFVKEYNNDGPFARFEFSDRKNSERVMIHDTNVLKELSLMLYNTIKYFLMQSNMDITNIRLKVALEDDGEYYFWNEFDIGNGYKHYPYDPRKYWSYEYMSNMENHNHNDVYTKMLSRNIRDFIVLDDITSCFEHKLVCYNEDMAEKLYHKYKPIVICNNELDMEHAEANGATRSLLSDKSFTNDTIVINDDDTITIIGDITILEFTMINVDARIQVYQFCTKVSHVEKAWCLGAMPIVTNDIVQIVWRKTIYTPSPLLIVQNKSGDVKNVIRDYNINDIDTDNYEEIRSDGDTIIAKIDDDPFNTTTIVELQRDVGGDVYARRDIVSELIKKDCDNAIVLYKFLQHLNNNGTNVDNVIERLSKMVFDEQTMELPPLINLPH